MTRRHLLLALYSFFGLSAVIVLTLALFGLPVLDSVKLLAQGAFGDRFAFSRTAVKSTPLLLAGLGMVVSWRGGIYNIGGEGQFIVGGLAGAVAAKFLVGTAGLPSLLVTLAILVGSLAGGAAWASLAALLYVKRGVEVVISTILLNFVAIQVLGWAVEGPLQEAKRQLPQTDLLPGAVMFWKPNPQMDFHAGVFVAIGIALIVYVILYKTLFGFRIRLVGANPRAARAARIEPKIVQLRALALSGALCGLAGGIEYTGVAGQLGADFAQGWGFMAIPVALLGGLHPIGVIFSALFFGAVFAGSENLGRFTTSGSTLLYVIQATAVLGLVGFRALNARRIAAPQPEGA